jgi:hypothetical protein
VVVFLQKKPRQYLLKTLTLLFISAPQRGELAVVTNRGYAEADQVDGRQLGYTLASTSMSRNAEA